MVLVNSAAVSMSICVLFNRLISLSWLTFSVVGFLNYMIVMFLFLGKLLFSIVAVFNTAHKSYKKSIREIKIHPAESEN